MTIEYKTRDENGNDIIKDVPIKEYPTEHMDGICPICHKDKNEFVSIKKIVSSKFTDWAYVGEKICKDCADLFSLYYYSYIYGPDGIRLLNVRQLRDELCRAQNTPFIFVITTTQKKHLFYRAVYNDSAERFAVNLETETIYTTCERMRTLFLFIEGLITLGASKKMLKAGNIPLEVIQKVGFEAIEYLRHELASSREIQIPLFCGQKLNKSEEEIICSTISILKAWTERELR